MAKTPSLPFPLFLPNLPRETLPVDFREHYLPRNNELAKALLERLTVTRKAAVNGLMGSSKGDDHRPQQALNPQVAEQLAHDYLSLVTGMLSDRVASRAPSIDRRSRDGQEELDENLNIVSSPSLNLYPSLNLNNTPLPPNFPSQSGSNRGSKASFSSNNSNANIIGGSSSPANNNPNFNGNPAGSIYPNLNNYDDDFPIVLLNRGCAFTWTNFSLIHNNITFGGADFEVCHTLLNLGIWYLVYAKDLAHAKDVDDPTRDANQKLAFQYFTKAAGVFNNLLQRAAADDSPYNGSDLKAGVYRGFIELSLAEAQTITIVRNEKKQPPLIVSSLCRDTYDKYSNAMANFYAANHSTHEKLLAFLEFKSKFFLAKAYYYYGVHMTSPETPSMGKGIKSIYVAMGHLQDSKEMLERFLSLPPKAKGLEALEYFVQFERELEARLNKALRDNEVTYSDPIPNTADELPEARSRAQPTIYVLPTLNSEYWTNEVYKALRAKQDGIEAAKNGKLFETTSTKCSPNCCRKGNQKKKTVAVIGGGVGGLTAAHELLEMGFDVTIYESSHILGGKAACENFNENLLRDHSIKNFSCYYYCLFETMKRIPYMKEQITSISDNNHPNSSSKELYPIMESPAEKGKSSDSLKVTKTDDKKVDTKEDKNKKKKKKEEKERKKDKKKNPTVFDNLQSYDSLNTLFPDGTVLEIDTTVNTNLIQLAMEGYQLYRKWANEGVKKKKIADFFYKHVRLIWMCDERKEKELDTISYQQYLGFDPWEERETKYLMRLVEVTAAAKIDGSAWAAADQALKMFGKFYNPHHMKKTGNVLNGTIQEKFLDPWAKHIQSLGGDVRCNQAVRSIMVEPVPDKKKGKKDNQKDDAKKDNNNNKNKKDKDKKKIKERISGLVMADGSVVKADYYVFALSYSALKSVINESNLQDKFNPTIPALNSTLGEKWGNGAHYALKALPSGVTPTVVYAAMGSAWSIVFYYITQDLWNGGKYPSKEAPVQLWITCSNALRKGPLHGKPYQECTEKEFLEEMLCQIQFREEDKNLIVDAVSGRGLDWWNVDECQEFPKDHHSGPNIDPTTLVYWLSQEQLATAEPADKLDPDDLTLLFSMVKKDPGTQKPEMQKLSVQANVGITITPSEPGPSSPTPAPPSPVDSMTENSKDQGAADIQKDQPLSEQVLINGPPLYGERVHKVNDHLQIVCESPLYARDIGMAQFPTETCLENMFFAGDVVKTIELVSTMEKANEGGKRAAHAICIKENKSYPVKRFQYDPLPLPFLRMIDSAIFALFD